MLGNEKCSRKALISVGSLKQEIEVGGNQKFWEISMCVFLYARFVYAEFETFEWKCRIGNSKQR